MRSLAGRLKAAVRPVSRERLAAVAADIAELRAELADLRSTLAAWHHESAHQRSAETAELRAEVRQLGVALQGLHDGVVGLRTEAATDREQLLHVNHVVGQLNHDVRSGSEEVLPLFLGYAERFRSDADAMVGASEVVERQLERVRQQIEQLEARSPGPHG